MLPSSATPRTGEALSGYLWRVAQAAHLPVFEVVAQVHPRLVRHRTVLGFAFVPPDAVPGLTRELPITAGDLTEMTLPRFGAFRDSVDTAMLMGERRALAAQRAHWWQFRAERFCAHCLAETGTWLARWLHPWAFVCLEHRVVLRDACHSCGRPARLLVHASRDATDRACSCGARWAAGPVSDAAAEDVALQTRLERTVHSHSAHLWGATTTSTDSLDAWRSAAALVAGSRAVPRWTPRPWLTPPAPTVARVVLGCVAAVVEAPDHDTAADRLRQLFDGDDAAITNRIRDRLPVRTALGPVLDRWQMTRTRVSTRLSRTHAQQAFDLVDLRGRDLPTLAPEHVLTDAWRVGGPPNILLRRAAVSLAAARLGGAATWADAGARVGISASYAPRVTRYVVAGMGAGAAAELTAAATRLADARLPARVANPAVDSFAALRSFAVSSERSVRAVPELPEGG